MSGRRRCASTPVCDWSSFLCCAFTESSLSAFLWSIAGSGGPWWLFVWWYAFDLRSRNPRFRSSDHSCQTHIGCVVSSIMSCKNMATFFATSECYSPEEFRAQTISLFLSFGLDVLTDILGTVSLSLRPQDANKKWLYLFVWCGTSKCRDVKGWPSVPSLPLV